MSSSAPTKRPATDEALESEPASKRVCVVASLDPADASTDEKKEKWYHTNHTICTVKVRVGDKWCLHLTEQQWWDTDGEYMREYMDPATKQVHLPLGIFTDWNDLVEVFDDVVPGYRVQSQPTIGPHGELLECRNGFAGRDLAHHIQLLAFLGCHKQMKVRLEELEASTHWSDDSIPFVNLLHWAKTFKSKPLWDTAAERCINDEKLCITTQPPLEFTVALLEAARGIQDQLDACRDDI